MRQILTRLDLEDTPRDPRIPGFTFYTAFTRDYAGIAAILNASFPNHAFCSESVRRSLVGPAYAFCTFVALDQGGAAAATASARKRFEMGEVAWVATRNDCRRRGLATALVQHTLNYLRESGFHQACAVLAPPTPESIAFWRALGFTEERP